MHRLLKSLRISKEQVLKETQVPESLCEIEYRQRPFRGLFHVSDDVIQFLVKLHNLTQKLVTHGAFHLTCESIHLVARGQVFHNQELSSAFMDLFPEADDINDDDTFISMIVELVAEHFLRFSIIEGLHSFKTAIPWNKKQAFRSKVTALSEREETVANKEQAKKTVGESLFFCPECNKECKEQLERYDKIALGVIVVIIGTTSNMSL